MKNFNHIIEQFKYHSLLYLLPSRDIKMLKDDKDGFIFTFYDEQLQLEELRFAVNDSKALLDILRKHPKELLIPFVPKSWIPKLEDVGAKLRSVFKDYKKTDFSDVKITENFLFLQRNEAEQASILTRQATGESRGFFGQTKTWFEGWLDGSLEDVIENNLFVQSVIVKKNENNQLIGLICVGVHTKNNPTCWIRELVVDKTYANQKIAQNLLKQGLAYGKSKGAVQASLLVDELNINAIHIYSKFGFKPNDEDGQIDMILNEKN
ncbi:GNAT family N-acetyltransferase [Mariniplasma anaerobium]|uniref:Uncharacterized protein n=1 Tax=Mariniplasma anaerobium TaxID=2735436 RepID=A0A7U9TJV7_9MOLU|nr:GNAT family N-acetyltransferase [Mariniplasma anaerobium]BCR36324.1 hypothetical protein MPAN_012170 [Mariniplasma anaerobium]